MRNHRATRAPRAALVLAIACLFAAGCDSPLPSGPPAMSESGCIEIDGIIFCPDA